MLHFSSSVLFRDPARAEICPLSLHDALPISSCRRSDHARMRIRPSAAPRGDSVVIGIRMCIRNVMRSEEHTSELQSHSDLVCRLLLEKKKKTATCPISAGKFARLSHGLVPMT